MSDHHHAHPTAVEEVEAASDQYAVARALLRRGIPVVVAALIAGAIVLILVDKLGDLPAPVLRLDGLMLLVAVAVYAILQLVLMGVWRRMLRTLHGAYDEHAERAAWNVSQLGKYVPTGAMLIVTRVMLAGRAGASRRIVLASVLYEFGVSFLAAVVVTAIAIGSMPDLRDSAFRWVVYAAPAVLLVALHPRVFVPLANRALERVGRERLVAGLGLGQVLAFLAVYLVAFTFAGLGILALTAGLEDIPAGDDWLVVATFSVGYVASVVGFLLPAGLGVRESGVALALSTIVPVSVAVSVAVVSRLVQIGVELGLAGAFALYERRSGRAY